MSRIARSCAVGLIAAVPFAAPTAEAKVSKKTLNRIYKDCSDGKVQKKFKVKALKQAKRKLPKDVSQYSGCTKPVLKKAIKKAKRR